MVVHLPMRGQVWVCAVPTAGPHPVVVLTVNRIATQLRSAHIAVITGTSGPNITHVPVGNDAGLKKYPESYVNCADLHTVKHSTLRRQLGLLSSSELRAVEQRISVILGMT